MRREGYVGLFLCFASALFCYGAFTLGIGKLGRPGPGFFPLLTGLIVGTLSLVMIASSIRGSTSRETGREKLITIRTILSLVCLLLFGVLVEKAGFFVCSFLFIIFVLRANGVNKWPFLLFFAAVVCVGVFFFFNVFLEARLPLGILDVLRS